MDEINVHGSFSVTFGIGFLWGGVSSVVEISLSHCIPLHDCHGLVGDRMNLPLLVPEYYGRTQVHWGFHGFHPSLLLPK